MLMRLPDSGSLLGSIVNGLGHTTADGNGIAIDAVGEAQLAEALTAMASGDLEYVILGTAARSSRRPARAPGRTRCSSAPRRGSWRRSAAA